jgi:hypothetical protein
LHRTTSRASDTPLRGMFLLGSIAPDNLEQRRVGRLQTP